MFSIKIFFFSLVHIGQDYSREIHQKVHLQLTHMVLSTIHVLRSTNLSQILFAAISRLLLKQRHTYGNMYSHSNYKAMDTNCK